MVLDLSQAQGEFTLPADRPEGVLLISGGSGITPVMSMLRTLCDEGYDGEIGFLNYARSPLAALYEPELLRLSDRNPHLTIARGFTRPRGSQIGARFGLDHARGVTTDLTAARTFMCGPPALADAVCTAWAQAGIELPAVEMFTAPPRAFDTSGADGVVLFSTTGREAANSGLPLLEQAEDAGLLPDHGCRMGICNTCSCRKQSGTVRNVISGALSGAGEEQIRICVSVPVGDVVLDL